MLKETVNKLCVTLYIYSVTTLPRSRNIFSLKDNSLNLSLKQAKNIFLALPSSPVDIRAKSVSEFLSYDRSDRTNYV